MPLHGLEQEQRAQQEGRERDDGQAARGHREQHKAHRQGGEDVRVAERGRVGGDEPLDRGDEAHGGVVPPARPAVALEEHDVRGA